MPKLDSLDSTDFLIQSWTQHLEHFLAIPTVGEIGLSDKIVQQILLEAALSVYTSSDKTSDKHSSTDVSSQVGVELTFNDDGSLQAKTHHDLRKSILGKTLAIINYYMQSFVHGGMYPKQVLEDWQHDKTIDLKTQATSVKCFLNDNFDDVEYSALHDLLRANKLLRISATQDDFASLDEAMAMGHAKFKTAFTLSIGGSVSVFDKALLLKPTPKVSTAIELSAEQKAYIKDYIAIHGAEPADYLLLVSLHQRLARNIEQHLEKMCPHEFAILQLAQLAVSYFQALKAEYKMPDLVPVTRSEDYSPVFTLPPLPVCQTRSLKITITLGEVFKKIAEFPSIKQNLVDYLMGKTLALDGQVGEHVPEVLDKILSGDAIKLSRRNTARFSEFFLGYLRETQDKLQKLILGVVQEIQADKLIDDVRFDATIADLLVRKDVFRINELYELIENQAKIAESTKEKGAIILWQKKWTDCVAAAIGKMKSLFASCAPSCKQLYYFIVIDTQEVKLLDSSYHASFGDISRVGAKCVVTPMAMPDSTAYTDLSLAAAIQEELTGSPTQTLRLVLSDGKKYAACTVKVVPQIIAHEAACELLQECFLPIDASRFLTKADVVQIQKLCTTDTEADTADLSLFLNKADDEGFSALHHISIFCTSTGLLDRLLKLNPELLRLKDTNGYTSFHCAVAAGNIIAVNYFITYLADKLSDVINLGTHAGYTPLMLACMHGKTEMVQILLAAGSDPNMLLPNGLYAAGLAILNKHIDAARVVLEYPATNVTLGRVNEESALHLALYNGESDLACELMTRGARVYERTDLGLSIACGKGLYKVIPIIYGLLESKRQELLQSLQGERERIKEALGNARRAERKSKGDPLGAILVVAANVVGAVCTGGMSSAFMPGIGASLINFGSEVCRRGIGNTSGEIQASLDAMNQEIDRVRSLALTHYPSGMGYTSAIHAAAENGDVDVVKKLVELEPSNLSVTGGAYHKTALMIALEHGKEGAVGFLSEITPAGIINHHGENTALCAAKTGQWEIADLLIARGDDPYLRDKTGMNYLGVLIIKGDYARYSKLAVRPGFDFGMRFTRNKKEYTSLESAWLHRHPLLASYIRQQSKIRFEDKDLPVALQLAIAADDIDFVLDNIGKVTEPDSFSVYACLAAKNASMRCLREIFLPAVKTADAGLILAALESKSMDVIHGVLPKVEDINLELDDEGNTAICYAIKFGLSELVPVLLGVGANLLLKNKKEHTPYHLAIKRDDKEMLVKLLKLDTEDEFPDVLLAYAAQERSKECIKVLMSTCKRLNLSKKHEKAQDVILEALLDVFYDLKLLEQLLKFVPTERYQDTLVMLLYFAIKHQKDEGLQFLLKLGADPLKVAEDAQEAVSDVPDTALAFAVSGNYINALSVFVEYGYAEQMRALTTLATSPYTRKIINCQNAEINDSIRALLNGLAKRDVDAVNSVLIDFPVNTFLFNNPDNPMGVKSPFLHHLFTLPFVADESEDDYFKFISAVFAPMLTSIDPLISDSDGNGLIRAIYFYSSLDSSVRRQRNLKLIEKYFPDSKLAILTQPDGLGATLIENVTQDGMLELVSAGYPLDPPDGHPLLVRAVRRGYGKATEKILELGQSVDCCSPCGTTPLMVAAKEGRRFVEYLLETWGANPNLRDYKGNTALYYALCKEDIKNVLSLLYYTDEVLTANYLGITHLMKSLQVDMPFVARALGYQMTDFSQRDRKGFGLMHYAADGDSIQGMQLLIEQGVDTDELSGRDLTDEDKLTTVRPTAPISHAASLGNAKMFVDLVKQGASLDKLSPAAISPLEYVKLKKQEMWQMLRQFPRFYDKDMRIAWLIMAARDNALPVLQELLLSEVPVSSYIENGNTALHLACKRNYFEAAAMLLQLGASVDQANSDGNTPLHMAVSGNAVKLITLMAGVGVNPDLQNSLGETALYTACSSGHTSLVLALVKIGANMALAAINGMTPSQIALHNGHSEIVTLLTIFGDNSIFEDATKLVTLKVDYSGRAAGLIDKLSKTNLEATAEERTPLHKAVMLNNKNAVVMICDLNPDLLLLADKSGLTPVQLAMSLDKKEMVALLKYCERRRLDIVPIAVMPLDVKPTDKVKLADEPWMTELDAKYKTFVASWHPTLRKWFSRYFESVVIVSLDTGMLDTICSKWDRFVRLLSNPYFSKHLDTLSTPPKQRISFQLASDYLERACLVLDKVDDPIVLRYLDQLPDLRQLQQALSEGFVLVTRAMLTGGSIRKYTAEQIQSSTDYFIIRAQIYASVDSVEYDATVEFFKLLNRNKILTRQKKIILAKCYARSGRIDSSLVNEFILSAEKVSQKLGDRQYLTLFTSDSIDIITLTDYIAACSKALAADSSRTVLAREDIGLLKSRFLTTSEYVTYPLAEPELDKLLIDYKEIVEQCLVMQDWDTGRLSQLILELSGILKLNASDTLAINKMLACLRLQIRYHFGIYPHNTQMLVLLALIKYPAAYKGRIGQVRTGEGKSTIVAMLAGFLALKGHFVDIITSSRNLAERDQKKYAKFFKSMLITSSHIALDHPTADDFIGQVIFGTNYDFEAALLKEVGYEDKARIQSGNSRPSDVVIVDEIDNVFIDKAIGSTRLLIESPKDYTWVYAPIYEYISIRPADEEYLLIGEQKQQIIDRIRELLNAYQSGRHGIEMLEISDEQLWDWRCVAIEAADWHKENIDYTVVVSSEQGEVKREITIMDYDTTGRQFTRARWGRGLHEFLEVKHQISPKNESICFSAMAHPPFFSEYKAIFGLTGTCGKDVEREEVKKIYQVDIFDVPPHRKPIRERYPSSYYIDRKLYNQKIIASVQTMVAAGRPVLIICKTIKESQCWSNLMQENGIRHLVLNTIQKESEDYILNRAGGAGAVTIATNTAGRGTDIILTPASQTNGGLHVIMTFLPENERVEEQGIGRAGRQGQPGTCELILHMSDSFIRRLITNADDRVALIDRPDKIEHLMALRGDSVAKKSAERIEFTQVELILHNLFKDFSVKYLPKLRSEIRELDIKVLICALDNFSSAELRETNQEIARNVLLQGCIKQAYSMLIAKSKGLAINWDVFVKAIKEKYIRYLMQQWAVCYKQINDYREKQLRSDVRSDAGDSAAFMQACYNKFIKDRIGVILDDPDKWLMHFTLQILSAAWDYYKLQLEKETKFQEMLVEQDRLLAEHLSKQKPAMVMKVVAFSADSRQAEDSSALAIDRLEI